jgi:hypothetical protein
MCQQGWSCAHRDDEPLAVTAWLVEPSPAQLLGEVSRGDAAQHTHIEDVDPLDASADGMVSQYSAKALDIRQFGHGRGLPARRRLTRLCGREVCAGCVIAAPMISATSRRAFLSHAALRLSSDQTFDTLGAQAHRRVMGPGLFELREDVLDPEIRQCFDGLDLVDPGSVSITQWRPDLADIGQAPPLEDTTGGVARKP